LDWPILKCPQAAVFNRPMTWINECGHITRPSLAESYCGRRDPGSFPAPCPDHCHYRAQLPAQRPCRHCREGGQKQKGQIQVQRTFDRRTGELNGSLSGSARFTSLLADYGKRSIFTMNRANAARGLDFVFQKENRRLYYKLNYGPYPMQGSEVSHA